jgi:hypothetical protein
MHACRRAGNITPTRYQGWSDGDVNRQGKGILGLNDSQKNTFELLPMIIPEMKARNMRVVHLTVE